MRFPLDRRTLAILLPSAGAFAVLFGQPIVSLVRDWWTDPEAAHGLLLAPVAIWLGWRARPTVPGSPNRALGLVVLAGAILLRYLSGLAAEQFTMRLSVIVALAGLTAYYLGVRQVRTWWLPFALLVLSVPLPEVVRGSLTLPLQFRASRAGAALLEWRGVPVRLSGNIIEVPGRKLFVTEACSGLRSLTALFSISVLIGAVVLRTWIGRLALMGGAVLVAIGVNAVRVFLTGFLVVFANPGVADGFLHLSEGWLLFVASLALTAAGAWLLSRIERLLRGGSVAEAPA